MPIYSSPDTVPFIQQVLKMKVTDGLKNGWMDGQMDGWMDADLNKIKQIKFTADLLGIFVIWIKTKDKSYCALLKFI